MVFLFLRDWRTTFIPSIAVPVSLIGTFGVMYLADYTVDNLSLMALTIATGFVVDDAIVVIENITRHLEAGMRPMQAALLGAKEIGFTVLSISLSLVAVFIPILLMGGIVGRLFREFAVVLSVAIGDFAGRLADHHADDVRDPAAAAGGAAHGRFYHASERVFDWILAVYEKNAGGRAAASAGDADRDADHHRADGRAVCRRAQGIFPAAGHGPAVGSVLADQATSFQAMRDMITQLASNGRTGSRRERCDRVRGRRTGNDQYRQHVHQLKPLQHAKG